MFADGSEWELSTGPQVCESCETEPATVHMVRVEGISVLHSHLCPKCAEQAVQQPEASAVIFAVPSGLGKMLGRLIEKGTELQSDATGPEPVCYLCGTTLTDLNETGLLGCPACYQTFSTEVEAALEGRRGGSEHVGKLPRRSPESLLLRREVLRLERMLRELVAHERFEEAASVRDRLTELGGQLGMTKS